MDEEELYSLLSFLRGSKNRKKIISYLAEKEEPQTPTDIAKEKEIHRNHVSNQLSKMKEKGLVEILNPDAARHRYYKLTEKGEELQTELGSISDNSD